MAALERSLMGRERKLGHRRGRGGDRPGGRSAALWGAPNLRDPTFPKGS